MQKTKCWEAVIAMILSKSKLSSLNLQSLSATQFNGLTEEMISLFQLSRLLPLHCYSQCSITLYLVQTASHKADHTLALITNNQKKHLIHHSWQTPEPLLPKIMYRIYMPKCSPTPLSPVREESSLNLSSKVVFSEFCLLLISMHKTEMEEGSLQFGCK